MGPETRQCANGDGIGKGGRKGWLAGKGATHSSTRLFRLFETAQDDGSCLCDAGYTGDTCELSSNEDAGAGADAGTDSRTSDEREPSDDGCRTSPTGGGGPCWSEIRSIRLRLFILAWRAQG